MRTAIIIGLVAGLAAWLCQAQTGTAPRVQFEVASIKPSPELSSPRYEIDNDRIDFRAMPLRGLIGLAFELQPYQLVTPDWTATERFDILATLPRGATKAQVPQMLQALLADRFGLVVHHEEKEQQVYALLPGKDGPKLAEAASR